ncbi:MAG: hypothetical protein LR015_07390, partial [Verrucomicrobia bacterium]|nr:hypothetical protein [Verrucomicrobiota bacterium]
MSKQEAKERLDRFGPNALPEVVKKPAWMRFLLQFHNVLIYVLLAAAVVLQGCLGGSGSGSSTRAVDTIDLGDIDLTTATVCDQTVASYCLFPFPNNFFTREDASSTTGLRVNFAAEAMPVALPVSIPPSQLAPVGVQTTESRGVDPAEWNRNDGFSP